MRRTVLRAKSHSLFYLMGIFSTATVLTFSDNIVALLLKYGVFPKSLGYALSRADSQIAGPLTKYS